MLTRALKEKDSCLRSGSYITNVEGINTTQVQHLQASVDSVHVLCSKGHGDLEGAERILGREKAHDGSVTGLIQEC